MPANPGQVELLQRKLELLIRQQQQFASEINALRDEITALKNAAGDLQPVEPAPYKSLFTRMDEPEAAAVAVSQNIPAEPAPRSAYPKAGIANDLEKFIGENLVNKIGIAILVIGVAIGARYSIEHELISPVARIIMGWLAGAALLVTGIKLKARYAAFSAVLVSGAMAILYFITYAAYSFYSLMPQSVAFIIMVLLTVATVFAAIKYNLQVIAHIGLVGAYAVPFLIGDDSGRIAVLFSYIAIINIGILVISFARYWKGLSYSSFFVTWLVFLVWYIKRYDDAVHFNTAFGFLSLYFFIFYTSFITYKLTRQQKFLPADVLLVLLNSFIFFATGYHAVQAHFTPIIYTSVFTAGNAVVHLLVALLVRRHAGADRNLYYLGMGLFICFFTITIPVQFDGSPVTILWAGEAALLFWIGRTKMVWFYEISSYLLMMLAFFSLLHDWSNAYLIPVSAKAGSVMPLLNIDFTGSMLFAGCFAFINYTSHQRKPNTGAAGDKNMVQLAGYFMPAILLVSLYSGFAFEISRYWDQLYHASQNMGNAMDFAKGNTALRDYKTIWLINYSLLFFSLLSFANLYKIRNRQLSMVSYTLNVLAIIVFLSAGLYTLGEMRSRFMHPLNNPFHPGFFHVAIRYVCYAFVALTVYACRLYTTREFSHTRGKIFFDALLHLTILWVLSSEVINWMELVQSSQSYKIGLSILWGLYSLMLIVAGISKNKKHLRMGAIGLFGVTLAKLFLYDIASINTIAKTIVFVALGILLLVISFLYNKYRHLITNGDNNEA